MAGKQVQMDLSNPLLRSTTLADKMSTGPGGTTMNLTQGSLGVSLRNPLLEMHSTKLLGPSGLLGKSEAATATDVMRMGDFSSGLTQSALGGRGLGATLMPSHLTENTLLMSLSSTIPPSLGTTVQSRKPQAVYNIRKRTVAARPVQMFGPTPPGPKKKRIVRNKEKRAMLQNFQRGGARKMNMRTKMAPESMEDDDFGFASCGYESNSTPFYEFGLDSDDSAMDIPNFSPMERSLVSTETFIHSTKKSLVNLISASLLRQPDFKTRSDPTRLALIEYADQCSQMDPEFILKAALYTRNELNIRSTANFLLAYASYTDGCRPYLKRYFSASIRLPSDWIDVAEQYQIFNDKTISQYALPSALRRAMVVKFPDFDKYQLAKYNKDSSTKKKQKAEQAEREKKEAEGLVPARGRGRGRGFGRGMGRGRGGRGRGGRGRGMDRQVSSREQPVNEESDRQMSLHDHPSDEESSSSSDSEDEVDKAKSDQSDTEEEVERKTFTLKQLIRKLHIMEPVEHVMCLVGKKYPATSQDFYQSRLPGVYDDSLAGKRMKLPTPETWETQVSMKGNKASTWEDLIDHKKLPFMAMLRNLRNLIKAGISEKHHQWVLKKLTDDYAVINSRIFPFQFFSAYEVLVELENLYERVQEKLVENAEKKELTRKQMTGRGRKQQMQPKTKETLFDTRIIERYRKAIDTAVKIATTYNVTPIKGSSAIFVDIGRSSMRNCSSMRSYGKSRQLYQVGLLLGLMCKYACEDSRMYLYDDDQDATWEVDVEKGTILDNMERIGQMVRCSMNTKGVRKAQGNVSDLLLTMVKDDAKMDNFLFFGSNYTMPSGIENFALPTYRGNVNPHVFVVQVNLLGRTKVEDDGPYHIRISGYSDSILRFIAERGSDSQLTFIDHIDEKYELKPMPKVAAAEKLAIQRPLAVPSIRPRWRTVRVFISSTFRDMHGERDLLTRFVFPELRSRAAKHFIHVYEIDLRWGITEEEAHSSKSVEICLTEVARCQFFIGLLGARYGWTVDTQSIPLAPGLEWVQHQPEGTSVTELEMYAGALSRDNMEQKAFFFMRDQSFEKNVPHDWRDDFVGESDKASRKVRELKEKIRSSGLEVYDGYPCHWGGLCDGKPIVAGLEDFGRRALNNLWNGIGAACPENENIDELQHENAQHQAFIDARKETFHGRNRLLADSLKKLTALKTGVFALSGKAGTGKTSLFATLLSEYQRSSTCESEMYIVSHVVGATAESVNIVAMLRRFCQETSRRFGLSSAVPEDYQNLIGEFNSKLVEASAMCSSPLLIAIDGLDLLQDTHNASSLSWIPEEIPQNVIFVLTAKEGSTYQRSIMRRKPIQIQVGPLDTQDKTVITKNTLARYHKTLDDSPFHNQLKLLLAKKEASNPLFLSLACDELRLFGLFDMVDDKLKVMPQTVPLLLQHIMERLEKDLGKELVSSAMCLLACARNGLDENDLRVLLTIKQHLVSSVPVPHLDEVMSYLPGINDMLPLSTFKRLLHGMQPFLRPSAVSLHLSLANMDVEVAIKQRYMHAPGHAVEKSFHVVLAGYFISQADDCRDLTWTGKNTLAFSEAPYHLASGGDYEYLSNTLCNLKFIEAKCRNGLTSQLLEDFQAMGAGLKMTDLDRQKFLKKQRVIDYQAFVETNLHILQSNPELTCQQAMNHSADSSPAKDVRETYFAKPQRIGIFEWQNRPKGPDPCVRTINSIDHNVTTLSISENGQLLATGTDDCVIKIYNISTGRVVHSLLGHASKITDVCFLSDRFLATAAADNTIGVWDITEGFRVAVLKGHTRMVSSLAWSREAKTLVSVSWDCKVKLWRSLKGFNSFKQAGEIRETRPVNCVCFHPEGQYLATGTWDATIKVWDVYTRTRKAVLRGHSSSVRAICYSPTGTHIASASLLGNVHLWSAANGQQIARLTGHSMPINKLTFSPQGHKLITVSDDQKIKVWSGDLGQLLQHVTEKEAGGATAVAIQPEGTSIVVGFNEGQVKAYSAKTGELKWQAKHYSLRVKTACFFKDSKHVITGSDDCTIKILDAETGKMVEDLSETCLPRGGISCVAVTTSGDIIAAVSEDTSTYLYLRDILFDVKSKASLLAVLNHHEGAVTGCDFNMDDTLLATCSKDMSVQIFKVSEIADNPVPIKTLYDIHTDWINSVAWSNTSNHLVTTSNDYHIKMWDGKTGELKTSFPTRDAIPYHVICKNNCIVTCHLDGTANVWTSKGVHITTLKSQGQRMNQADIYVKLKTSSSIQPEDPIPADAVVDDWGTMVEDQIAKEGEQTKAIKTPQRVLDVQVVTVSEDGSVQLWRPMEGNEEFNLEGHAGKVVSVSCSPDNTIATSATDRTVRLWKPQSVHSTSTEGHRSKVTALTFIDDEIFVSGSKDGDIKIWRRIDGAPKCLHSLQAHEQSVEDIESCGSITSQTAFATVSVDSSIKVWRIKKAEDGSISVKLYWEARAETPLCKVLFWKKKGGKGEKYLVTIDWKCNAAIWVIGGAMKTSTGTTVEEITYPKSWPVRATIHEDVLYMIGGQGHIFKVKLMDSKQISKQFMKQGPMGSCWVTDAVLEGKEKLLMALDDGIVYNVDGEYRSAAEEKDESNFLQLPMDKSRKHEDIVNCMEKSPSGLVFTACQNSVIKVWKDTVQVGQFFTPAPVTQMKFIPEKPSTTTGLIAADMHGHLISLQWTYYPRR